MNRLNDAGGYYSHFDMNYYGGKRFTPPHPQLHLFHFLGPICKSYTARFLHPGTDVSE
jgi:hypothetical protein